VSPSRPVGYLVSRSGETCSPIAGKPQLRATFRKITGSGQIVHLHLPGLPARMITSAMFSTVCASNAASHTRDRRSASEIGTPPNASSRTVSRAAGSSRSCRRSPRRVGLHQWRLKSPGIPAGTGGVAGGDVGCRQAQRAEPGRRRLWSRCGRTRRGHRWAGVRDCYVLDLRRCGNVVTGGG
jgi:hypothetical protein